MSEWTSSRPRAAGRRHLTRSVGCSARQFVFLARAVSSVIVLTGLGPAAGALAAAQGVDTTRHVPRDSAAPALADTIHAAGGVRPTAVPAADSARAMVAAASRDTTVGPKTASDSALQRARSLVAQGQTTAARALVDSLLASTPPGSMAYASVLYTRATLATDADSAESDYRRVSVEYAASPRASDALLRLAQLELARGERSQAAAHLDRLTREQLPNQTGIVFARTELQVGLAYFDLQDPAHACAALIAAHAAAPPTDVELRNRIDYNAQRCPRPGLASNPPGDTTHGAGAAGRPSTDSLAKKAGARGPALATRPGAKPTPLPSTPTNAASASTAAAGAANRRLRTPGFTVQVAAYQTHAAAAALVERLRVRGYVARIFGASAPFRVRVGRFAREAQADSAAHSLKGKGITGFVTAGETPSE